VVLIPVVVKLCNYNLHGYNIILDLEENNIERIYRCHIKPERFVEKTVIKSLKMSIKKLEKVLCEKPSGCLPNARLPKMPKNK
jgi:hypothetical protein